jgi:hypothetical protein
LFLFQARHAPLAALAASFGGLAAAGDFARRPLVAFLLLGVCFASYLWAARRFHGAAGPPLVLGIAALLRLLLIPLPPTLSDDTLRYVWDGRVLAAGFNPYRFAPESPELAALRDPLWERMPHKDVPSVYPPLALALFTVAGSSPHPTTSVKVLVTLAELVGCFLLVRLAAALGRPPGRAVWYCWNPLAVLEVAGMGHVDGLLVAAMIAAVWLLVRRRSVAAGLAAAAAVLAKLVPVVAFPLWARFSERPARVLTSAALTVAAAALPVAVALGGVPPGLVEYGVSWEFNGPIFEPLWRVFARVELDSFVKAGLDEAKRLTGRHELWNRFYPFVYPQLLAKMALAAVFGIFYLAVWRSRSPSDPAAATGRLLGGVVLCSATVYPWYLLWVLPWAALGAHRAWLALSALLPLAYLPALTGVPLFPWVWLGIWGPFLVLLGRSSWSSKGTRSSTRVRWSSN